MGAYRIAVIGGGISGTFVTKYLAEYDASNSHLRKEGCCVLEEIAVYDISPPPPGFMDEEDEEDDSTVVSLNTESSESESSSGGGNLRRSSADPRLAHWQGSRVSSITLEGGNAVEDDEGLVVELGGSIVYDGNQLIVAMMEGDSSFLLRVPPMDSGACDDGLAPRDNESVGNANNNYENEKTKCTKEKHGGFGIYHGNKTWLLNTAWVYSTNGIPTFVSSFLESLLVLWRYGMDLFRIKRAVRQAIQSFDRIYTALNDTEHNVTYFDSPSEIWRAMGLEGLTQVPYHDLLDDLGLCRAVTLEVSHDNTIANNINEDGGGSTSYTWDWRRWMPGMVGCLRSELLTGVTLNTYNQDLSQMNGLVGLVSYVPVGGELFRVKGGNHRLMESALQQARRSYEMSPGCWGDDDDEDNDRPSSPRRRVRRHQRRITTVVSGNDSMTLYEDNTLLGKYDIVILAAPLQQCRIRFLMESPMGLDGSVLHDMPLSGIKENPDNISEEDGEESLSLSSSFTFTNNNEHGQHLFASSLPPSATTPYTSVVTTVVSNATVNKTHFGLRDDEPFPRSVLVSERGKALEGITTLTILSTNRGLIKTFSSTMLDSEKRTVLFGPYHILEYVQVWGGGGEEEYGRYGGATPSFNGGRNSASSLPFLLYDGARHWGKIMTAPGPALYYINAIESAAAAIEISAIGAKSTAKLVARRLGMISPIENVDGRDEL